MLDVMYHGAVPPDLSPACRAENTVRGTVPLLTEGFQTIRSTERAGYDLLLELFETALSSEEVDQPVRRRIAARVGPTAKVLDAIVLNQEDRQLFGGVLVPRVGAGAQLALLALPGEENS